MRRLFEGALSNFFHPKHAWKFLLQFGPTFFGIVRSLVPNKGQIQDDEYVKPDELRLIITALKKRENIRNCDFKPTNEMNSS